MRWLILTAVFSIILAEWYGKDFIRKNRFFPQRRPNNLIYLLCAVFFSVLLFRLSCSLYSEFPHHIINLFGWLFFHAAIIRFFSVIWEQLFEKAWCETESDPRSQIVSCSLRMGVGVLLWFLILNALGKGEAIIFPLGDRSFLGSGFIAITGFLFWVWK